MLLQQQAGVGYEQKVGVGGGPGWAAYVCGGVLFAKAIEPVPEALYPDRGSQLELYTDEVMQEVESLGPLHTVEPGATVEHVERWLLAEGVEQPGSDDEVEQRVRPHIDRWLSE